MGEKLVVGPINKGLRDDRTAFVIDNDSFPTLINAYQWRGRVKRKRGTTLLVRLQRFFDSGSTSIVLANDGSGNGIANLITGFSLETNSAIIPGVTITDTTSGDVYTDPAFDGILVGVPGGSGTINYASGDIFITGAAGDSITVSFNYNPDLPVMGLRDLILGRNQFPATLAFDTIYSYNITSIFPATSYDVSFYKNPIADPTRLPGYIPKTIWTPTTWNGQDYQQFWTVNYQGALWATNGIDVPFTGATIGMQFKPITGVVINAVGPPAIATLTIVAHGLVQGDFIFVNEVGGITGINFQTGYVISANPQAANAVQVEFPNATLGGAFTTGGIAQYLTNRSDPTKDCLRWYDGDPTNGIPPLPSGPKGWVNFAPPLSRQSFSIADTEPAQYYLVGARMIIPFKDRLLFLGPVIQTSSSSPIYLQDTVIYSQNGTPYYTASFTGDPSLATTQFFPILTPNQITNANAVFTATPNAYWEDQTGFGGFISAGIDQPIVTASDNEDVLIIGFDRLQTRFVYTGNDVVPFNFFIINSELGSSSTFSTINLDKGVITRGNRGIIITSQVESKRIDLEIPDQVFEFSLANNGTERITAQRDFINEWIYLSYPVNQDVDKFPNQTLQYNYRDDSWAIFNESYTTYGQFRPSAGYTWATIGEKYNTWLDWNDPWNAGQTTLFQAQVIAGNMQGFVLIRADGTNEGNSLYISNISTSLGVTTITSPNHTLNEGDYIVIGGALGTVASQVNGKIFSVGANSTANTFTINPSITTGTYIGGGLIKRMYVPYIQTKQFPSAWGIARKTRIGAQQYLFTKTPNGQIQLLIFLSQNDNDPWNDGPIIPEPNSMNNSLIYSTVLFTSPEQIIQNCLNIPLGNVGNGIALSFNFDYFTLFQFSGSIIPGSVSITVGNVATFTDDGVGGFTATGTGTSVGSSINYPLGLITIAFTIAPLNEVTITNFQYLTPNILSPTAINQAQIWHRINTSLLGDTVQLGFTMSDSQMRDTTFSNQFAEIELHGFILDLSQSQLLA